jgi:hypothetical protein
MRREGKIAETHRRGSTRFPIRGGSVTSKPAARSATPRFARVSARCRAVSGPDLVWTLPTAAGLSTASSATAAYRSRRRCRGNARAGSPRDSRARFARPAAGGRPWPPIPCIQRINKVFMLDEHFLPGTSILKWEGPVTIAWAARRSEIRIP